MDSYQIGMNLLLWGTEIDDKLFPVLEQIHAVGYQGVEIPVFETNPDHWKNWPSKLKELNLVPVAVTLNGPELNQISADRAIRQATLERNKKAIDCAAILGAKLLTGPFHSSLGVFTGVSASETEQQWATENLQLLSEYAGRQGVTLALEYLNRFESYLVSSTDELIALADRVNHPSCKLMFDTFHANIEEKDLAAAIHKMGRRLVHVQLSENDRSTLGRGHINFPEVITALNDIGYSGMLSVEAFSSKLAAAHIWRKMFESENQLITESLAYIKKITL
jgi:D-psicose/D-tagatose/L-ribulose 3-epimerase